MQCGEPTGGPPQLSENFTQADLPGSDNAQCQDTTEGPIGNLGEGADQCNQTNRSAQTFTEAPPHMARMPQAIGNYGLGARLPGSFTGGTEPIEDSPLTERNTPTTNNPGGNTPAREISSAVTGLMALEAMWAISDHPASAVPMSRDQALAEIQRYLLEIEQQWLEYDEGTSPSDNWGMCPVGNHHAKQFRQVHQVLEGVEDRSDSLASNMIKRESPHGYDLGERSPHFNNQGRCLAQELTDMQRCQGRDQQDDETMGWHPTGKTDQHISQVTRRTLWHTSTVTRCLK